MPKPSKTQELITKLEQNTQTLEERIAFLEKKAQKLQRPTQWYEYFGYFVLILLVVGMCYLIWLWVMSEQGYNVWFPEWMLR
jgi:uncharacterized membrane protein YccC